MYFFDAPISTRRFDEEYSALAAALHDRGVQPGDRIAMYLQNVPRAMSFSWRRGRSARWWSPDTILGLSPLFHVTGLIGHLTLSMLTGAPLILFYRFDAQVRCGRRRSSSCTGLTVPELADLAAVVLEHLNVGAADIIGFSNGGAVAQQLAVQHAHRVHRLVLVATTCALGTEAGDPRAASALASPWRYYCREYFKRTAPVVYGGTVGRDETVQDRLFEARALRPPHPYGYFLQLVGGSDWSTCRSSPTSATQPSCSPVIRIRSFRWPPHSRSPTRFRAGARTS